MLLLSTMRHVPPGFRPNKLALRRGTPAFLPRCHSQTDPPLRTLVAGCGSFEVSWLRCENVGFAVFGVVDTLVFAAEVVVPVGVEVAAGDEGAEPEDGLGAFQPPSRARYVHSILDDVPARAFDDPGGDGPAFLQRPGVVPDLRQSVVVITQSR